MKRKVKTRLLSMVLALLMVLGLMSSDLVQTVYAADQTLTVSLDYQYGGFDGGFNDEYNDMNTAISDALIASSLDTSEITQITLIGGAGYISKYNWKHLILLFSDIGEGLSWPNLKNLDLSGMTNLESISYDSGYYGDDIYKLTSLKLPDSLTTIGNYAFDGCNNLALTTLPDGLTTIGDYAFQGCTNLALTKLPDGVTSIGWGTFYGCRNLALTALPDGVSYIGWGAFDGCFNLALTALPSGVTSIGVEAFDNCKSLTTLTLPESLATIGGSAYKDCISLKKIIFTGNTAPMVGIDAFDGVTATVYYPDGAVGYTDGRFGNLKTVPYTPGADNAHHPYINGYENSTFKPDSSISRAEVAQLLYNILGEENTVGTNKFRDVLSNEWYYHAVACLTDKGIISGYEDETFKPNGKITRAELVALVVRYAGLTETTGVSFPDVPSNHWATGYIQAAKGAGYISGYPDGSFAPENSITRAEAVKILNSMLGRTSDKDELAELILPFIDVPKTHWAYYEILEAGGLSVGTNQV